MTERDEEQLAALDEIGRLGQEYDAADYDLATQHAMARARHDAFGYVLKILDQHHKTLHSDHQKIRPTIFGNSRDEHRKIQAQSEYISKLCGIIMQLLTDEFEEANCLFKRRGSTSPDGEA